MRAAAILLVDDDPNDVAVAFRALEKHALAERTQFAHGGAEALDYLKGRGAYASRDPKEVPKVILLDLKMPKVDGWDVLREVRSDPLTRHVPVVILSSSDSEEDVRESYRRGANSFIVKRFEPSGPGGHIIDAARYWLRLNTAPATR